MKTLIVLAHPDMNQSRIHRAWRDEALRHDEVVVHDLYNTYPNDDIDVVREQQLLDQHPRVILQFPIYWYGSPPLLKKWLDLVLEYGWAYGDGGRHLVGKEIGIAISTFTTYENYQPEGSVGLTIDALTSPFEATARRVGALYLRPFVLYGVAHVTDPQLRDSAKRYIEYATAHHSPDDLNRSVVNATSLSTASVYPQR